MKTLQEIYTEIIGSDELKKAFAEAAKGGKVTEFLKGRGCEAGLEEIKAFLKEKADQQLSEEELDSVAGGTCNKETGEEARISTLSAGFGCLVIAMNSFTNKKGHAGQQTDDEGRLCNKDK